MSRPASKLSDEGRPGSKGGARSPRSARTGQVWYYGANDFNEDLPVEPLKSFRTSATGAFREDFIALCQACGVLAHPGIASAPKEDARRSSKTAGMGQAAGDARGDSILAVQSILLDRAACQALKFVLPLSTNLEVIRIMGCLLDVEMLSLLRAGIAEPCCVTVLQLDWNPLEIPVDVAAVTKITTEGSLDDLDGLEKRRDRQQAERTLRAFGDLLTARFGTRKEALKAVALASDQVHAVTAELMPMNVDMWTGAFVDCLGDVYSGEAKHVFNIADGPGFGPGDGLVTLEHLRTLLEGLPELTPEEEAADPIGQAFAAFMDATCSLEHVSFRYCDIGRIEAQAMARAMRDNRHIRSLNLWGNRICDGGAAALAEALDANHSLQYIGLSRNLVTHTGLEAFSKVIGPTRITDKDQADQVMKAIKEAQKQKEKQAKSQPPPKKDAAGRERYASEMPHVDGCEEMKDTETGQPYWMWFRNTTVACLNLEHNPVTDADVVLRLLPYGYGDLMLRGVPCAAKLSEAKALLDGGSRPPTSASGYSTAGWNLIL